MADPNATPHHRRSIRLRDYDYSQPGAYYVTICTQGRKSLFGEVSDGILKPNGLGRVIEHHWLDLPNHHRGIALDEYVIMPNHIHGIIVIGEPMGEIVGMPAVGEAGLAPTLVGVVGEGEAGLAPTADTHPMRKATLATIIGSFKSACTRAVHQQFERPVALWQRSYYEHVIRSSTALARIQQYITDNPAKWAFDRDHPANWRQ